MRARGLRRRHVEALAAGWKAEGLSVGTMMNRAAHLRWWAKQVGHPGGVTTAGSTSLRASQWGVRPGGGFGDGGSRDGVWEE